MAIDFRVERFLESWKGEKTHTGKAIIGEESRKRKKKTVSKNHSIFFKCLSIENETTNFRLQGKRYDL